MLKWKRCIPQVLLALSVASTVIAGQVTNVNDNNVAIDGYDLVSYFTANKAIKGSSKYSSEYKGVMYYFSSADNQSKFDKNAEQYMPKYEGWCAFAIAKHGKKVKADPETFKMYNGELLFFFNDLWEGQKFNTIVPWNLDEENIFSQAETNWSQIQ